MSRATPVQANSIALPLRDESVDLIVTSPPYFALRSYRDGGEPTPQAFLEALWAVTAECWRVNLGDKRSGSGGHSHEFWFHLTKEGRYFSATDELREPCVYPDDNRHERGPRIRYDGVLPSGNTSNNNPLGKLPGSVWTIASEPLTLPDAVKAHHDLPDHFAAFPQEWPRRLILGWSPSGVCVACGEGRRPVVAKELVGGSPFSGRDYKRLANGTNGGAERPMPGGTNDVTITGYACACPDASAPTRPAVVCDVFGGTGTVAGVARQLGRTGVSFDLSHDYGRLAAWFLRDGRRFAKTSTRTDRERQGALAL